MLKSACLEPFLSLPSFETVYTKQIPFERLGRLKGTRCPKAEGVKEL